jgi:peptidoglycan-associated lipoprotein
MRANLIAIVLVPALLAGCATSADKLGRRNVDQSGALKIHPGLLGQPVPPELQQDMRAAPRKNAAAPADAPMQLDSTGLRMQRSVYFDFNSSDVKADFDPALKSHARYLATNPKSRVRIEGNADERGSAGYNNILALKRAENVRQVIIGYGATDKQVVVKSLGESKPKLKGRDEESWAENRRSDVVYEREE